MAKRKPKKLTKKQLKVYERLLLDRKRELLRQALTQDDGLQEIQGDHSADPVDMAGFASSLELISALGNNERVELAEIDHALAKITGGTYGLCEESGELINALRLEAIPTARYTMEVQQRLEQNPSLLERPRRRVLTSDDLLLSSDEES